MNEIVLRLLARGVEMPVASRTSPLSLAIQGQHPDDAEALRRGAFVYNGVTGTWRWSAETHAHARGVDGRPRGVTGHHERREFDPSPATG